VVYLSGYGLLHDGARRVLLAWLGGVGADVPVVLDPGPLVGEVPAQDLATVLGRTDWLSCNAAEASLLTGCPDAVEAARALAAGSGCRGVVVRTGAQGCVVTGPGGADVRVPGAAVTAVDTTGAGDTHTGVLLAALAAGLPLERAALRANHAAACSVTRRGPATAPTAGELAVWLAHEAAHGP
jgi:sugar/nucleoside kinase (ribokinase family)